MNKFFRKAYLMFLDAIIIFLSVLIALHLVHEGDIPASLMQSYLVIIPIPIIGKIIVFYLFSLYDSLWEYASIEELIKVVMAVLIGNMLSTVYFIVVDFNVFYGIFFMSTLFEVAFIGGIRFSYRFFRRVKNHYPLMKQHVNNVLIIGSGATASMIATEIKNHPESYGRVVGFIDDSLEKYKMTIGGIKVLGNRYDIFNISKRYHVSEIILAIPTYSKNDVKEILDEAKKCNAKVRIIPGITEIFHGQVSMKSVRDIEIADLLGREEVQLNVTEIASYIEDRTILITGGGGSIGSEICRQVAKFEPKQMIIVDIYENNAYDIQMELKRAYGEQLNLEVLIASVRDKDKVMQIMETYRPDVVFHAAAHKHVPLMEKSPLEALKNNVFGTLNVVEAANLNEVKKFVLISTDKAVNPTNVMGASKRICEMIIQSMDKKSKTNFVAVRFGNVLGSSGSVIPLFQRQIEQGGPVTVTHKEIIRYFMTIPEASQLVIEAGAMAKGGEIFVLDMGDPVKIYNLAEDLIRLAGLKPNEDIEIKITGLRPGEKLYEELLMSEEGLKETKNKKIFIGKLNDIDYDFMKRSLELMYKEIQNNNQEEVMNIMQLMVPTYRDSVEVNRFIPLKLKEGAKKHFVKKPIDHIE